MRVWGQALLVLVVLICLGLALIYYGKRKADPVRSLESAGGMVEKPLEEGMEKSRSEAKPVPKLSRRYCSDPHKTTCGSPLPSYDLTGKVQGEISGEVFALRRMRSIIHENPSWTSEQVQEELARRIYTDERKGRAESGFAWVKEKIILFIENQPETVFSQSERQNLLERLKRISMELPPPASVYSDAVDLISKNTVYYERTPQEILRLRVGGAYLLSTTSWYNFVYTFAHELAHAIDPCELQLAGVRPAAYEGLISCFVEAGWVSAEKTKCGTEEQISEVFADWLAAEITAMAIEEKGKGLSRDDRTRAAINATRDLCEQSSGVSVLNLSFHQHPKIRIGFIMGQNPRLRRALACRQVAMDHCGLQTVGLGGEVKGEVK